MDPERLARLREACSGDVISHTAFEVTGEDCTWARVIRELLADRDYQAAALAKRHRELSDALGYGPVQVLGWGELLADAENRIGDLKRGDVSQSSTTSDLAWEWAEVFSRADAKRLMGFRQAADGSWHRTAHSGWLVAYVYVGKLGIASWRGIRPLNRAHPSPRPDRSLVVSEPDHARDLAAHGWDVTRD